MRIIKNRRSEIERFRAADEDNDLELTREEFFAFLYPRNYQVKSLKIIGRLNFF